MRGAQQGGWLWPAALACGSLAALLFHSLPPPGVVAATALVGAVCLLSRRLRWLGLALLACCWSLWRFQARLDDRLGAELAGQVMTITGRIESIPQQYDDYTGFRFGPEAGTGLPRRLLLRWYDDRPPLAAGQLWQLEVKLKPPWGRVNFQGEDRERWLFANGIGGQGNVRDGHVLADPRAPLRTVLRLRARVFDAIGKRVPESRARGIMRALAVADRSGISRADRQVLILTGTAHLLAVSGLHIGLAAAGGVLLMRALVMWIPLPGAGRGPYLATLGGGLLAAFGYALMAGLGVSTLRSLLMLAAALAALGLSRSVHPARAWLLALAGVLLIDPFAPLGAGFWFSFLAVAALLAWFLPRTGHTPWWRKLPAAQFAVILVLLPASAAWFQAFSLAGYAANLVAIPWISLLVVPFVLAGVAVLPLSAGLAGGLWTWAAGAIDLLWPLLETMARTQGQTLLHAPTLPQAALALAGAFMLLLPQGLPWRWYGLGLLLPLFLPPAVEPDPGDIELEMLDTGQGTSLLLTTAGSRLLYDSGPGDGVDASLVAGVIVPALNRRGGAAPDRVVISHGDLDHAGGLGALRRIYPRAVYYVNRRHPLPGTVRCTAGLHWDWGVTHFDVWHPGGALPYRGNDSSCTLSVSQGAAGRILLAGDISTAVERRLLTAGMGHHDVMLVPHHGSDTSSSLEFLVAIAPRAALATAGLGNRFGFPRTEIVNRYHRQGAAFWTSGDCGAVRVVLHPDGRMRASSARRQRPAVWRWPAVPNCP